MGKRSRLSPAQLANKGAPIELAKVGADGRAITDDSGGVILEEVRLRFTNFHLMRIEEEFGGQGEWAQAMLIKPVSAVSKVLGIYFEESQRRAVERIPPRTGTQGLVNAILAAWEVANGTDPTKAVEFLTSANAATRLLLGETDPEDGTNGASDGSSLEGTSTSSGD